MKIPAILKRRSFAIGLVLVGAVAFAAIFADLLAPFDPVKNNYRYRLGESPTWANWISAKSPLSGGFRRRKPRSQSLREPCAARKHFALPPSDASFKIRG